MSEKRPASTADTQVTRRVKYGLNVTVAALAAAVIVVLLNVILFTASHRYNLDRYLRFDFTSTRQYTLSPQTLAVLRDIKEPYRIVSMLVAPGSDDPATANARALINHANDLIDEYARYNNNLTIDHIDPELQAARRDEFYSQLKARYADKLKPEAAAVDAARKAMDEELPAAEEVGKALGELANREELATDKHEAVQLLQRKLQVMSNNLARYRTEDPQIDQQVKAALDHPTPDYTGIITSLKTKLAERADDGLAKAIAYFGPAATAADTPSAIRAPLQAAVKAMEPIHAKLASALDSLRQVTAVEEYDQLLQQLAKRDVVVILSPIKERVITLDEMFRRLSPDQEKRIKDDGGNPEPAFQGEERLTGALVSLSIKVQPLVVFVSSRGESPTNPGGGYSQVADRLRRINFDVEDWSPVPKQGPMGQPMPPGPPPQPKPGQKAVWVILPVPPPNPMDPTANGGGAIATLLAERLRAGDSALVMPTISSAARLGVPDPIADVLVEWGIRPQTDRILLHEIQDDQNHPHSTNQINIVKWPTDNPVSAAIAGMPGIFLQAIPLQLDTKAAEAHQTTLQPLADIQDPDVWAEQNLQDDVTANRKDPATAGKDYVIAAAANRKTGRLIAVGDPIWANDQITTYGLLGAGSADLTGARFPGNSELFVNSVYWLAGLDQLIAASARTQDIRRVHAMAPNLMIALQWSLLIGMPVLAGCAGLGVWLVRRRA